MAGIKRRHFLQGVGSTLAALGLSQMDIVRQGNRYGRALAETTARKLALLVGVNAYPEESLIPPLNGCLTDVELQYQLLVHRFGFNPADIVKLTDQQATRQGILTTFEEHLIKQAKPGDVVVFHFSGHGSQVLDPDRDFPDGLNSTLVPIDSALPPDFPFEGGPVADITGHTLFLLMSAIQSDNLTVVLDSCHSGGGTRGNVQVRSRSGGSELVMGPDEVPYQESWLTKLNMSPQEFIKRRRQGIAKGVAITAAKRDQYAADVPFEDFYAGAFTYLMTQYLWQQTGNEPFTSVVPNVARATTQLSFSGQEPGLDLPPNTGNGSKPVYFTQKQTPPAEAVITKVMGNDAEVWLGGIDPRSLAAFQRDAVLSAIDDGGQEQGLLQLVDRQGLVGRGKLLQPIKTGFLLQEQTRGIPRDVTLRIGLDPSLGNGMAVAQTALQTVPRIEATPLQQGEVHYILGRMTAEYRNQLTGTDIPVLNSVGLFSQGLDLIPGSYGMANESVVDAVERLRGKLRSLLAARLVKLTLNTSTSRLNLMVTMTPEGQSNQLVASAFTVRGVSNSPQPTRPGIQQVAVGTGVEFNLQNNEAHDLYLSVLQIDSAGDIAVLFPNQWTASADVTRLNAGQRMLLPDPSQDGFRLVAQDPKGATEILIVASTTPLDNALRALRDLATQSGTTRGPIALGTPVEVVGDLLNDLSTTRGSAQPNAVNTVDTRQMAALSITFDVI